MEAVYEQVVDVLPEAGLMAVVDAFEVLPVEQDQGLLSPGQTELMDMLSRGYSNKEIAKTFGISVSNVKHHRSEIITILNVNNIIEGIDVCFDKGILTVDADNSNDKVRPKITNIEHNELVTVVRGLGSIAAGAERGASERTVYKNRDRMRQKLGAVNMTHVPRRARELGIPTKHSP